MTSFDDGLKNTLLEAHWHCDSRRACPHVVTLPSSIWPVHLKTDWSLCLSMNGLVSDSGLSLFSMLGGSRTTPCLIWKPIDVTSSRFTYV